MPIPVTMQLKGVEEITSLLKQLPDELIMKEVKKDQFKAMLAVRDEAIRQAPEDTGRLKEFIGRQIWFDKASLTWRSKVGLIRLSKKGLAKKGLSMDAYYGVFVEFGTRFQKPKPFMRPAYETQKEKFVQDFTGLLKESTERTLRRLKKH